MMKCKCKCVVVNGRQRKADISARAMLKRAGSCRGLVTHCREFADQPLCEEHFQYVQDWIAVVRSTDIVHAHVPVEEYTSMIHDHIRERQLLRQRPQVQVQ